MVKFTTSLLLLLIPLAPLAIARPQKTWAPCETVHIFVARGGNEPYEMETPAGSRQMHTVRAICNAVAPLSCGYEDIVFEDAFVGDYCGHVQQGVDYGRKALWNYAQRCPQSKLVLTGYSLGGHVVGDILGGGGGSGMMGGCTMPRTKGMAREGLVGKNLIGALTFGDVRYTGGQSYNRGSGANMFNGYWPRDQEQLADLNRWSDILFTYCHAEDPVCAAGVGGGVLAFHGAYFAAKDVYTGDVPGEAAAFIKSKLGM